MGRDQIDWVKLLTYYSLRCFNPAAGKGAQRIPRKHKNSNNMLLIEYQGPGEKERGGGRGPIDHP